jgi:hypothetical protein
VGDNGCTLLDIVPIEGISSTKFRWSLPSRGTKKTPPEKFHFMNIELGGEK